VIHSRKLETLEHFKKYSNHLIFIVLIGLLITFGFSIREELKVGNNDGTLRIQAEYDKAEKSRILSIIMCKHSSRVEEC
jgi:predicted negative regulator of RcsB-dependent stress response